MHELRLDGRGFDELRPLRVTRNYTKYAEGSVLIETGDTKVVCSVTLDEKMPSFLKGSGQGWVTAEYGMLPRATQVRNVRDATRGRANARSLEIQRLIGRSVRAVVDLPALGERTVWLDCDVIQADGGTRTAAITGSFIALAGALQKLVQTGSLPRLPLTDYLAAVSVGKVDGSLMLDLCFAEDSRAEVDMNVVMTSSGKLVEVQGTAEHAPFSREEMEEMLDLAAKGIVQLIAEQKKMLALGELGSRHQTGKLR